MPNKEDSAQPRRRRASIFTADLCANCDRPVAGELFCSELCRQTGKAIRYARRADRDGRSLLDDVLEAIETKFASVLGGGYPEKARRMSLETRNKVFQRAARHCERCGRELDFNRRDPHPDAQAQIHHAVGSSNQVGDLRAWCRRCNLEDAQSKMVPIEPGTSVDATAAQLHRRRMAAKPIRLCDDEVRWVTLQPGLMKSARARARARLDEPSVPGWQP